VSHRSHLTVIDQDVSIPREATGGRQLEIDSLPEHLDRLFRAAYALCGSLHDAEDLVQETYARVMSRPRVLRKDNDLAYLTRVLRNIWIDMVRVQARQPTDSHGMEALEFVPAREADPDVAMQARAAYAAIGGLTEPLRETIVAVDIVGLSYKEAARALKTREGTIMSRLYRARDQVAELMEAAP
jgi:RNA polymerase sigma-70 factor (ECF subfamily)